MRKNAETRQEGWPVEWTMAGFVIVGLGAVSQLSRLWPMPPGHCTSLGGMCTALECTCPEPLRKRELTTPEAQACYQCVASFCPVVAEGDPDCSVADCECEDPTWPRQDLNVDGPCWQCVRPPTDFTVRSGQNESCLAREAGTSKLTAHGDCLAFRYNGARIMEKSNGSCLAWQPFGNFWELQACGSLEPSARFQQLEEDPSSSVSTLCSGHGEFCVEVAENLCTEEEGRCSTETCRCEKAGWTKQELQTLNGAPCFTCVPASKLCGECGTAACECEAPLTKVKDGDCFRCRAGTAFSSEASKLGLVVIFVFAGLAVGAFLRRSSAVPGKRGERRWSERLAAELEDLLESIYEGFLEKLLLVGRLLRPFLRRAGRCLGKALDEVDMALEPFYCFWDSVMEVIWDWVVVQHERLVFLVGWLSAKRVGTNASLEELEEEAGASKGRKARKAKPEKRRGASPEKEEAPGNQPAHREVNLPEKVEKAQEKAPSRAQRKLQQRREKAEAASVPQETKEDPPIDDSWIDELEARESKNKAKREQKCAKAKKRGAAACKADMCFDTDQILCEAMHGLYLLAREVGALEGCEEPEVEVPPAERPAAKRFKAEDTEKAEAKEATREEDSDPNGFEHRRSKKSASRRLQQQLSERTERSERAERVRVPERVEPVEEKRQKQKMEAKEPREPKEPKRREVPLANPLPANPRPANPAGPSRVMSQRSQMTQPSKQTKEPKESKESKEKESEPKKPRAWSEVVAPWAKSEGGSRLGASAPEFVPLAQQLQELGVHDSGELGITTVRLAGLAPETTGTGLFQQLDCWGLGGSFDFLHIMLDGEGAYANINFIDPIFVTLFCYLCQEYQLHAEISVSEVQGIKALTAQWVQSGDPIQAVVVRNAMPSQWAVNAVNTLLSPQLKSQFRKTKLCAHNRRKRCEMGPDCPFAHCKEELQPMPNLAKTKICYNYFRRRCNEPNCKFAHGSAELRSPIFNWEASEGLWNPLGEAMHGFDFSGIDFSQMQAFPVDASMYYMQEQEEVQAFSAENGEQDNSILFEALPRKDEGQRGKVAVRVRRTFMEVTQVDGDEEDDDDMPIGTSMRRSFSDSHLETLKEGMDETEL